MASSDSQTFSDFVTGDKQFEVPLYQRNYSWEKDHVEDLWDDLVEAVEMDRDHYIGTFLLMDDDRADDSAHKIIDGQQRLTTLTILLFELQERLDELGKETEARKIRGEYIARYGDQKLTLAGDDKTFFKRTIMENVLDDNRKGQKPNALSDVETASPSQGRLLKTKELIRVWLREGVPESSSHEDYVDFCIDLYHKIQSLPLLEYTVSSRSEAARIFQTVNDRGKSLTDLEITKSYLMHRVSLLENEDEADSSIESIQDSFNEIYDSIENISSGPSEDRVQRYHFIMWDDEWGTGWDQRHYQNHLEHLKEDFRAVGSVEEILRYVQELERMFGKLDELYNYTERDDLDNKCIETRLSNLFIAGRLANFYPLLMVAYDQYTREEVSEMTEDKFCELLEKVETFIVRTYIIEQKSADTGRTRVYPLARKLHYNAKETVPNSISPLHPDGVIERLKKRINDYCSDSRLESTLGESDVYRYYGSRKSELRLLLYTYESYLEDDEEDIQFYVEDVVNNRDDRFSIEHVWPQTPKEGFDEETKELVKQHTHRLGNLALMTPEDNAVKGNDPFEDKKKDFTRSKIRMLEAIFAMDEWGVNQIEKREQGMIRVIKERWPDEYTDS
ncbi:DUF262 domain-containing protein [Halobellus salinisoli]|uniref:DUF262 domain-containing protein n=1 Tax=Halobellus salinisoli TaxID=3108500 RepID=UPI00300AD04B